MDDDVRRLRNDVSDLARTVVRLAEAVERLADDAGDSQALNEARSAASKARRLR